MRHVATRVPDDVHDEIQRLQDVNDCSQSEAVRTLLRRGIEHERLQRERDALQNQLNTLAGTERAVKDLVRVREREERVEEHHRERRNAPVWRRAKWFVFGYSD